MPRGFLRLVALPAGPKGSADMKQGSGVLHVLHSFRTEGSQRLAIDLVRRWAELHGEKASVATLSDESEDVRSLFVGEGAEVFDDLRGLRIRDLARRAEELVRRIGPRAVLCYTVGPHVAIAHACRRVGTPLILHMGNAPPEARVARLKIAVQLLAGRLLGTIHVACSEYVRNASLGAYPLRPIDIVAVPNGVDLQRFAGVRERRDVSEGDPVFGMVGSLEVHKRQEVLLDALHLLRERGIGARLVLVGTGSRRDELAARAQSLDLGSAVTWVPLSRDVRNELRSMDVFAYAVSDQEGLGIALVEALAAGLPAVASDVGAAREVLGKGAIGTLVSGGANQWADGLLAAVGMPPVPLERLARFDIDETARAYRRVIDGSTR